MITKDEDLRVLLSEFRREHREGGGGATVDLAAL